MVMFWGPEVSDGRKGFKVGGQVAICRSRERLTRFSNIIAFQTNNSGRIQMPSHPNGCFNRGLSRSSPSIRTDQTPPGSIHTR